MNKFDIMREKVSTWSREARQDMRKFIDEAEETEKELEELKRDVKRYFELLFMPTNRMEMQEMDERYNLLDKLSKGGGSNESNH